MYKLTIPADGYDEKNIRISQIKMLVMKHRSLIAPRLKKNQRYYEGKHIIKQRKKTNVGAPNNQIVCNHPKDIADTSTGYFLSSAITFKSSDNSMKLDKLTDAFDTGDVDEVDHDNALDISRLGLAYEYVYVKSGENTVTSKNLSPITTFIVYDDTIEENELFAVYYDRTKNDLTSDYTYIAYVLTENYRYRVEFDGKGIDGKRGEPELHNMGEMPIIMYQNNKDCFGDYEQQIDLVDAYNTLMSDRINDKEQFLNALLILYGSQLADDMTDEQGISMVVKALKELRDNGFLELPEGAKAEYISRTFDETGVETLRKAIKEDIYTFSHVPNMTDENFSANASGVAMEYKLLSLENITKTKERYYKKGLKKRIKLYCNYLSLLNISANPTAIMPMFKRGLPKNILELSQIIGNLKGFVSRNTLIQQLPFVDDPDGEIVEVDKENKKAAEEQQKLFANGTTNFPPEDKEKQEEVNE